MLHGIARRRRDELLGVRYHYGDIQDPSTFEGIEQPVDVCIHTAAAVPDNEDMGAQQDCISSTIQGTHELVRYLLLLSPDVFFILISTIYVYRPNRHEETFEDSPTMPETFYGLSKLYSEYIVSKNISNGCILRLASLYDSCGIAKRHQPLLYDWIERASRGEQITVFGDGLGRRNYLHVDDAVRAILCAIDGRVRGVFNIAGKENLTLKEIATAIVEMTGKAARIPLDPLRTVYTPMSSISIDKAKHDLMWEPAVSLNQGMRRMLK